MEDAAHPDIFRISKGQFLSTGAATWIREPRRSNMTLPASGRFQFTADLGICRVLNGMWQVSGAHGAIDPARAVATMFAYHDAGFTTWDLADHYGPAEDFIGSFRRQFTARYGGERLAECTPSRNGFRGRRA